MTSPFIFFGALRAQGRVLQSGTPITQSAVPIRPGTVSPLLVICARLWTGIVLSATKVELATARGGLLTSDPYTAAVLVKINGNFSLLLPGLPTCRYIVRLAAAASALAAGTGGTNRCSSEPQGLSFLTHQDHRSMVGDP